MTDEKILQKIVDKLDIHEELLRKVLSYFSQDKEVIEKVITVKGKFGKKGETVIQGAIEIFTTKALKVNFEGMNQAVWIPMSQISNSYDRENKGFQEFHVKNWVLQEKGVIPK